MQLWEIFSIFCGKLIHEDLDDGDSISSELSYTTRKTGAMLAADESKTLEILAIPQFIKYFRVSVEDEVFFE